MTTSINQSQRATRPSIFSHVTWLLNLGRYSLFAASLLAIPTTQADVPLEQSWHSVKHVYDGDTVTLNNGERVRLLGINTPEIKNRYKRGEAGGLTAKRWLKNQVKNRSVRLEKDRTKRDKYNRLLAHLFTKEGLHINLEMVKMGLAIVNIHPPNFNHQRALLNAQEKAEIDRRGLWKLATYQPRPILKLKHHKFRGWGRFTGIPLALKKGKKFERLIFSKTISLRIPQKNKALFLPLEQYIGKKLEIRGWPSRRNGHYSILVRHPSALIVK